MSKYDKFMIDNPPDNHLDRMKLHGLFLNLNQSYPKFLTTTPLEIRFKTLDRYMSILNSKFNEDFFENSGSDYRRILNGYNGDRVSLYYDYILDNNELIGQCVLFYDIYDLFDRIRDDGYFKL